MNENASPSVSLTVTLSERRAPCSGDTHEIIETVSWSTTGLVRLRLCLITCAAPECPDPKQRDQRPRGVRGPADPSKAGHT
jgi:hypothetical protein